MDKRNIFTKALIVLLALMFLSGVAFGAVSVLSAEGQMPPEEPYQESLSALPAEKDEIIKHLKGLVSLAATEKAKLDIKTEVAVDDDSISFGENGDMLVKAFQYAKASIINEVTGQYSQITVDFGSDFTGELWNLDFDTALIAETQGKEDGDNHLFNIVFLPEGNPFESAGIVSESFHMRDSQKALKYFRDSYAGFAQTENIAVRCARPEIEVVVNRLSDRIGHIKYIKNYDIQADVTFLGELAALGTRQMSFRFSETTVLSFTWLGLRLAPKELDMEKGDIKVISAFVTASGDTPVRWSSSAPDIASVDSDGYVKGAAVSPQAVVITAEFDFLGRTYTDTCEIFVKVPVKKVEISAKKLTLAAGETKTLEAGVKPKDATIKDVIWQSSDPAVATVDAGGRVTAVSKGTAEIIALSKDGYYKVSCAVTVTGG
jgi:hypothetical protein